jgi:hypothetical protein
MGFIILKILVIHFFFLFSSAMVSSEVSLFSDLFVSSLEVMGFINTRERERRRGIWKCCEEEERRKKRLGIVTGERRETGILALK